MAKAKSAVPQGYHSVTPVLCLEDSRQAIDWYTRALGAEVQSISAGPDGKVMHAAIRIGNSHLMLHDEMQGMQSARKLGGSPVELWLYVDDVDAVHQRAVDAGAKTGMPVGDQFWGDRWGTFTDPYGLNWSVATHKEDLSKDEMEARQTEFFAQMAGKS